MQYKGKGTGLGLSICSEIVGLHGGRVGVRSSGRAGEGAEFVVALRLPVLVKDGPSTQRTATKSDSHSLHTGADEKQSWGTGTLVGGAEPVGLGVGVPGPLGSPDRQASTSPYMVTLGTAAVTVDGSDNSSARSRPGSGSGSGSGGGNHSSAGSVAGALARLDTAVEEDGASIYHGEGGLGGEGDEIATPGADATRNVHEQMIRRAALPRATSGLLRSLLRRVLTLRQTPI
jgi:hypothetical protein